MSVMVFDLDDLCDDLDPWAELHALKSKYPKLKVTLFAIPARCSDELLARYGDLDWVELGVHGYHHSSMECAVWGYEETSEKLAELEAAGWNKLFKAPGWILSEEAYAALHDAEWGIADHVKYAAASGNLTIKRYTYNMPGSSIKSLHGHTWDCMGNGPSSWLSMFDDIDEGAEFSFVSEVVVDKSWNWNYDEVQAQDNALNVAGRHGSIGWTRIRKLFESYGADNVVDFGGYDGTDILKSGYGGRCFLIDGDPAAVHRSPVNGACASLEALPIPDQAFDWGFTSHVLEHVSDLDAAWSEMRRVCKSGIMVVVPTETEDAFADNPAHVRRHTASEWVDALGIEIVEEIEGKEIVGVWAP